VVVTTAYSRSTVLPNGDEAAFLRKPYQLQELLHVLNEVLPAQSCRKEGGVAAVISEARANLEQGDTRRARDK
jgi:hypothetical protein